MGKNTGIAWTDHTWNPWWGCQRVSPGCEHCYAEAWDARFNGGHWGPKAERRFFGAKHWAEPLKWNAAAEKAGRRARVFCASMADVFEDRRDLDDQRTRLWGLISLTPHLDWQLLTKRPENLRRLLPDGWLLVPMRNVWIGTTVEDQARADERIPILLSVPASVRFLSCEPLLSSVDIARWLPVVNRCQITADGPEAEEMVRDIIAAAVRRMKAGEPTSHSVDWVIVGGESGTGARPMLADWARRIVDDCGAAGTPCFVKQLGGARDKRDDPAEWPNDLRVREFPGERSERAEGAI